MANKHSIRRYRNCYAKLLRLYSKPYYQRFGEGMEQTFSDLLHERAAEEKGLFRCALWMFAETTAGIVRENITFMLMRYKIILRPALVVACLLMVPFFGGAPWNLFDYVVGGGLLFGTGLAYELVARKSGTIAYRFAVAMALGTALLLVWVNLAVGIIGSEDNPANLLYAGVLAVGLIGAGIARLQPHGMSQTLFAMAAAQALVPVIALIIWNPQITLGVLGLLVFNAIFVMLFVGSAFLFRRAIKRIDPVS